MRWTGNIAVHHAFEIAGYVAGAIVYVLQRRRRGDTVDETSRATVFAGAAAGALLGARLLFWLCDPALTLAHLTDPAYLFGGKTIVGGLLGGLIGVELAKKLTGITRSTGDLFVEPLIAAMAIGRIGCFLYGPADHTAGNPSALPWAIAIADGVPRHPVALYEVLFLLMLIPTVRAFCHPERSEGPPSSGVSRDPSPSSRLRMTVEGDSFRVFLTSYLAFRLLVDFLKPDPPRMFLGMNAIQWACVGGLLYYASTFTNASRNASVPFLRRRRVDLHDVLPQD